MPKRKNAAAVALGKKGGKTGGKARWAGVSDEEKSAILSRAAKSRWSKEKQKQGSKGTGGKNRKRSSDG